MRDPVCDDRSSAESAPALGSDGAGRSAEQEPLFSGSVRRLLVGVLILLPVLLLGGLSLAIGFTLWLVASLAGIVIEVGGGEVAVGAALGAGLALGGIVTIVFPAWATGSGAFALVKWLNRTPRS